MSNRTYVPDMANRHAMADPDAQASDDPQADGADDVTAEQGESDEDPLETPGRAASHFIVHDEYANLPAQRSLSQTQSSNYHNHRGPVPDASDVPRLEIVFDTSSEASTTEQMNGIFNRYHRRPTQPIPNDRSSWTTISTSSSFSGPLVTYIPGPNSDRENTTPPMSLSELGDDDLFVLPQPVSYHSEMYLPDPDRPIKPYSLFPTSANDPSLSHLREISGLASWTVSSFKPSCGVAALLNPSTATFWQSDGPQPHLLNIHFFKLVRIVKLRVYLDFELDESYTPTKLSFAAGTHEYDAVEFAEWRWDGVGPKGWVDVDLSQCGSEEEREREQVDEFDMDEAGIAGVLRCFFLQVRVLENHQNGKDTHIRGVQIFARDDRVKAMPRRTHGVDGDEGVEEIRHELELADWMGEPELR